MLVKETFITGTLRLTNMILFVFDNFSVRYQHTFLIQAPR